MNDAPHTQSRHALRWVLGVGLAFVVAVLVGLQLARRRADERWTGVVRYMYKFDLASSDILEDGSIPFADEPRAPEPPSIQTRGGNSFRAWRESSWECLAATIVLRQDRNFLGSQIEVRLSESYPDYAEAMRAILAAVDVELIVEP